MEHGARWVSIVTAVVVVAIAAFVLIERCPRPRQPETTTGPAKPRRPPPTPGSALAFALALPCEDSVPPTKTKIYDSTFVSAGALDNRTLHDCQKLMNTREEYGPLVAILVPRDTPMEKLIAQASAGVIIADIVNYDPSLSYDSLHIEPYLNCLWVKGPPDHPEQWQADVRQATSCSYRSNLSDVRTPPLSVHAVPYTGTGTHHSTARWGWKNGVQFIGIHCGKAWCEIGPQGFTGSGAVSGDSIGLSDEQYLAIADPTAQGKLRPSHVLGRIEPYTVLETADAALLSTPTPVARIILRKDQDEPPPPAPRNADVQAHYADMFALSGDVTEISMWYDANNYYVGTPRTLAMGTPKEKWTKLNRCPWTHAAVGAVRWRWDKTDEYAWFACSDGCCSTSRIGQIGGN